VKSALEAVLAPAAVRAAGAIPVPLNHRLVADEVAYILDHSDARAVVVSDAFLGTVAEVRSGASRVRSWIVVGSARRPWAEHVDDLIATGDPTPSPCAGSAEIGVGSPVADLRGPGAGARRLDDQHGR